MWFRFSPASILLCKHAPSTNLICIVTRDVLDVAEGQTEASRTHSLFVCQARNGADAYNFCAAVTESKAAWAATAKRILLQNFSLQQIASPAVRGVAVKHDATSAQVLVRWASLLWKSGKGVLKLPKSISPKQVDRFFNLKTIALTDEELASLAPLSSDYAAEHGGAGPATISTDDGDKVSEISFDPMAPRRRASMVASMTTTLTLELGDLKTLMAIFRARAPDGVVTVAELEAIIQDEYGTRVDAAEYAEKAFASFDVLKTGRMDYELFCVFLSATLAENPKEQLEFVFQLFDTDESGTLDVAELTHLITIMSEFDPHNASDLQDMPPEMLAEMLHMDFDDDGDGAVSMGEFISKCSSNGVLTSLLSQANMQSKSAR